MSSTNHSRLGFLTEVNGKRSIPIKKGGLNWYTHGPKVNEGTGAGVCDHDMMQKFSFSLGQYATAFQAEVYAIKACAVENTKRGCLKRN
jgi:hypothetical protein